MPSLLARQHMHWRDRDSLSRQLRRRDNCVLPRRCLAQPRMACICVAVAWVHSFVVPPWLAQQMPSRNGTRYCCCFASPFFLFFSFSFSLPSSPVVALLLVGQYMVSPHLSSPHKHLDAVYFCIKRKRGWSNLQNPAPLLGPE